MPNNIFQPFHRLALPWSRKETPPSFQVNLGKRQKVTRIPCHKLHISSKFLQFSLKLFLKQVHHPQKVYLGILVKIVYSKIKAKNLD